MRPWNVTWGGVELRSRLRPVRSRRMPTRSWCRTCWPSSRRFPRDCTGPGEAGKCARDFRSCCAVSKRNERKLVITITGEFFPETFPAFRSPRWSRGDETPLATEMRLFCACERWAFTRLVEGASRDTVKEDGQELFGLNSRYVDDARLKAQAVLDSSGRCWTVTLRTRRPSSAGPGRGSARLRRSWREPRREAPLPTCWKSSA